MQNTSKRKQKYIEIWLFITLLNRPTYEIEVLNQCNIVHTMYYIFICNYE